MKDDNQTIQPPHLTGLGAGGDEMKATLVNYSSLQCSEVAGIYQSNSLRVSNRYDCLWAVALVSARVGLVISPSKLGVHRLVPTRGKTTSWKVLRSPSTNIALLQLCSHIGR
jgi:hypothetical protein